LRRNGKQQACETCRKCKIACDHTTPHCGRCVRRQITSRCIYHPAPMTRTRAGAVQSPLPTPQHTPSISDQRNGLGQSPQASMVAPFRPDLNHVTQTSLATKICSFGPADKGRARSIAETTNWYGRSWETFPRPARYYGPTSFSSVFTENDLLDSSEEHRRHPSSWPFGQPLLLVKHTITTLWSTFGEQLAVPRTSEKLTLIAETLFKNEEKPLPPAPDDGMEWLNTFTGPNLRFEMLGMLFCFFGMAYHSLLDGDPRFNIPENHGRDRKQSSWRMKECADICLKMVWKISFLPPNYLPRLFSGAAPFTRPRNADFRKV
jgi:hypothetical protein